MTKVIVVGQEPNEKKGKKIELLFVLTEENKVIRCSESAGVYRYVELIAKDYSKYDLMYCYDNPSNRGEGVLVLGNFNDGIV